VSPLNIDKLLCSCSMSGCIAESGDGEPGSSELCGLRLGTKTMVHHTSIVLY
jgi:hypothetical protein